MSKFKITSLFDAGGQPYHYLESVGAVLCVLEGSDLADLASATQAALAEQNSRVMAGECVCELVTNLTQNPICTKGYNGEREGLFCNNKVKHEGVEFSCAHDAACHSTQNTENQGE